MDIHNLALFQSISFMALASCALLSGNKTEKDIFASLSFVNSFFMFAELADQWKIIKITPTVWAIVSILSVLILISANFFVLLRIIRMRQRKDVSRNPVESCKGEK